MLTSTRFQNPAFSTMRPSLWRASVADAAIPSETPAVAIAPTICCAKLPRASSDERTTRWCLSANTSVDSLGAPRPSAFEFMFSSRYARTCVYGEGVWTVWSWKRKNYNLTAVLSTHVLKCPEIQGICVPKSQELWESSPLRDKI